MAGDAPGLSRGAAGRAGERGCGRGEGVGQHSVEMAERGRRTSFQQGFSGKTNRFGWVFRWVAYILMYPRESGGQNRQKNGRISPFPPVNAPGRPVGKEPARNASCKVRLTTCVRQLEGPFGGRDGERGDREGKNLCFSVLPPPRTPHPNGSLSHSKCCGFRRNCEFFHKNRPDLLGEKVGASCKKTLTSILYGAMMIPIKSRNSREKGVVEDDSTVRENVRCVDV